MSVYNELAARAKRLGLSIKQVCEKAGVNQSTVYNWRQREPSNITDLRAIEKVLEEAEGGLK